jgi:hypothetical protein
VCRECQGRGLLGSWSLGQKLTQELVEHIKVKFVCILLQRKFCHLTVLFDELLHFLQVNLPDLRTTICERLGVVQDKLQQLGKGVSTDQHQRQLQFAEVKLSRDV